MTVNHGVLGSSPCSGAIARGLQERCRSGVDSTSVERKISCCPKPFFGSLAQLVQSICLTSRGSAVRIRQLPRAKQNRRQSHSIEWLLLYLQLWELAHISCRYNKSIVRSITLSVILFPRGQTGRSAIIAIGAALQSSAGL